MLFLFKKKIFLVLFSSFTAVCNVAYRISVRYPLSDFNNSAANDNAINYIPMYKYTNSEYYIFFLVFIDGALVAFVFVCSKRFHSEY